MASTTTHPGEVLRELLVEREISQRELSSIIQIAHSHLHNILSGDRTISPEIAVRLEAAGLETAIYWLQLQINHQLESIKSDLDKDTENIRVWKEIQENIPMSYFRKHEILNKDREHNINAILSIYGASNVNQFKKIVSNYSFTHFRKSSAFAETRNNVIAWSMMAEHKVKGLKGIKSFAPEKKDELTTKLRKLFVENDNLIEKTKKLLASYGIKFTTLDRPSKTPVDGKSFMSENNPSIVLSLKYKRLDNFAYTLMHELGHVYTHLTKSKYKGESFFTNNTKNDLLEFEADNFARNELIPIEEWNEFVLSNEVFSDDVIYDFAERINIHPAVVRGRVCFEYPNYYRRASEITKSNKIN